MEEVGAYELRFSGRDLGIEPTQLCPESLRPARLL
eukprot:COSAG01_NODE_37324_length_505_cov_0.625616_2_plen_34_part_01